MNAALREEIWRFLAWLALGVCGGWVSGYWLACTLAALALYLCIHLRYLWMLRTWLVRPKAFDLPEPTGLWGEVFYRLLNMQRRHRKRKKRLVGILAEFQASTAALPDGAVVLGPHGEIVWFNDAAQVLLGLRTPQDLGLRVPNLVRHPAFTDYFGRDAYPGEAEAPSPINPAVTLAFKIIPYGNGQRLMIVRDVSEIRRLEEARRDFVANASHELRTPLTVLRGYLDILEPETRGNGPLAELRAPLSEMRSQVGRMESLVGDLLKLARLEAEVIHSRQDKVDVPGMLWRLHEEALTMSKGRHRFDFDIDSDLQLFGRESELQSVFGNLIGNAVHYTPEDGEIRVRWWEDEQGAHFSVSDSGIGIAPSDIPRITERFYRVDVGRSRASGGTGLGLSIVKHALELHESRLEIESKLGAGSTFSCTFPEHRVRRGAASRDIPRVAAR